MKRTQRGLLCNAGGAVALLAIGMIASPAHAVNYPKAGGDIADNGPDGWNGTMPGTTEKAQFNQ